MAEVIIESIIKREFGPEQIRKIFGDKVKRIKEDLYLSPLLESIVDSLMRTFLDNKQSLGITYWRKKPDQDATEESFEIVVDGKIVDWEGELIFIRRLNYGEALKSLKKIILSGPEEQVEKMLYHIEIWVAAYNFDKLRILAAERLKKKNVRQLRFQVRLFYGV